MERAEKQAERILGGEAMAAREKRWSEMGIEEKVERLRMALRCANERGVSGQRIAMEAIEVAKHHEHSSQGGVLMPVEDRRNHPLAFIGEGRKEHDIVEHLLG